MLSSCFDEYYNSMINPGFGQSNDKLGVLELERLQDLSVRAGKSARFSCGLARGGEATFIWTKEGQMISNSERFKILSDSESSLLTVRMATPSDAGTYTCIAKNLVSEDRVSANLKVDGTLHI